MNESFHFKNTEFFINHNLIQHFDFFFESRREKKSGGEGKKEVNTFGFDV